MIASQTNVRISPKKANLVAGLVRNKPVKQALVQLEFTPKKAAAILKKLIKSATANAVNNFGQSEDQLVIQKIIVNKGVTFKRGIPVSRGRYNPILKRNSNITVEVGVKGEDNNEKIDKQEETKKKAEKTTKKTAKVTKKEEEKNSTPKNTEKKEQTSKTETTD